MMFKPGDKAILHINFRCVACEVIECPSFQTRTRHGGDCVLTADGIIHSLAPGGLETIVEHTAMKLKYGGMCSIHHHNAMRVLDK